MPQGVAFYKRHDWGKRQGVAFYKRHDWGKRHPAARRQPLRHPFPLARYGVRGYPSAVNSRAACLLASVIFLPSCEEQKEMLVTETRGETSRDRAPKLFATSDERFRDAKPSPVKGETPAGWLALPPSQFRALNYRFGDSGLGEVWVSIAAGTVLDNVNRWLNQFEATPVDQAGLAKLRSVPIAGTNGTWVEAEGQYAAGMGAPPKPGFALAGVVSLINGQIVTVKMVGPQDEVAAAKPVLEIFAKSLKMAE